MVPESVDQKLRFARTRLDDLKGLIEDNRLAADPDARHQLTQEFFLHVVGAIEYLAQLVNERRSLCLASEDVAVYKVVNEIEKRDPSDPLVVLLKGLSADTRKTALPADPYSEEGFVYRTINYRNGVSHRNINPFHFRLSAGPKIAFLWLDPRDHALGQSTRPVDADLSSMFSVVDQRCRVVLEVLR